MGSSIQRGKILFRTTGELASLIRRRDLSAREVVTASLERLDDINPRFNAFVDVYVNEALEQARATDHAAARGEAPAPLASLSDRDFGGTDEQGRYHGLDMTAPFNLVGQCPAVPVPSGVAATGLPTGLQIVGRRHRDLEVLKIGALLDNKLS